MRFTTGATRLLASWQGTAPVPVSPSKPMRQLMLLRHAKSSWDDPKLSDHARPLNTRGRQAASTMRDRMRELGLAPDLVLVSSARRTLQTLEALSPWDDQPLIEPMDSLYLASAPQLFAVLNTVPETVRSVLLIGHNPGLHELALSLAGAHAFSGMAPAKGRAAEQAAQLAEAFPTAALAEFSVALPWSRLGPDCGHLTRFLSTRDMPEVAP